MIVLSLLQQLRFGTISQWLYVLRHHLYSLLSENELQKTNSEELRKTNSVERTQGTELGRTNSGKRMFRTNTFGMRWLAYGDEHRRSGTPGIEATEQNEGTAPKPKCKGCVGWTASEFAVGLTAKPDEAELIRTIAKHPYDCKLVPKHVD